MNNDYISVLKLAIFSHFSDTGAAEELRDWLLSLKIKELVYISFPFGGRSKSSADREVRASVYRKGKLVRTRGSMVRFKKPEIISYTKDFIYALYYGVLHCLKTDILFCGDNLLSSAGNILKFFRIIKKTVYYMIDYTPVRYKNPIINGFYYYLDRKASYGSDVVWPLSERTIEGRFEDGKLDSERVRWYSVPYGNHFSEYSGGFKHNKNNIIYMGRIDRLKGVELLVPIAEFLRKKTDVIKITVVGDGPYFRDFTEEIKIRGLSDSIFFTGFIEKFEDIMKILQTGGIAVAPYYPFDKNNYTYYADPGKIKSYLGAGLPVVLTSVPPIAEVIKEKGAGLIADYTPSSFGEKIIEIMNNYDEFEKNALDLGRLYDWKKIFSDAFKRLLL